MTFGVIDAQKASFPISKMYRPLGVGQSGVFAWQERPACRRQQQDMNHLAHQPHRLRAVERHQWQSAHAPRPRGEMA